MSDTEKQVATIRMSRELHQALKDDAYACRMSLNEYCISILKHFTGFWRNQNCVKPKYSTETINGTVDKLPEIYSLEQSQK